MGGSWRSGTPFSQRNLDRLENIARETLKTGAPPPRRNIFISFANEDIDEVRLFRGQAKNENNELEFSDRSLQEPYKSTNEEYIKRGIREHIRQASVTVVYLSKNSADSTWVDWEIRESIRLGKGVIAVHKGDTPPKRLPKVIEEYGIEVVAWKHKNLTEAINRAADKRTG